MPGRCAATNRAAFLHIDEFIGATACGEDVEHGKPDRAHRGCGFEKAVPHRL